MAKEPVHVGKEEMEDYLVSIVKLKLWFLWEWLAKHPAEKFLEALEGRVDIFRKTSLNASYQDAPVLDVPKPDAWKALERELDCLYSDAKAKGSFESFEAAAMERLTPLLLERAGRDLEDLRAGRDTAHYQCGSLRYNLAPDAANPQRIGFHIANACHPGSPFDDRLYFPSCLMALATQCQLKFGVTEIATGTWLNSHPKWLELFPKRWQDGLSEPNADIRCHYGFWGQFLTARKTFNHKLAAQFRKTGQMPFLPRSSWCSIEELRKHLLEKFFRA